MTIKYFKYPFGISGDLLTIPNPTQLSGVVSYQAGYPIDYQLVDTDPSSLNIQRNQFNQLMFDTTGAIQQLQQNGFPIHITSAMNDGVAYAYDKNSYVRATDNNVYYSLVNGNVDVPPTANWQLAGSEVLQYFNFAVDTGIADHYVIAPDPAVTAYADGDFILLRPAHANTGACDIDVNSLGVIPIKTMKNVNPAAGMIIPTGAYILMYFGGNFVLCNPTLGSAAYLDTGTANGNIPILNNTAATAGSIVLGSITFQWGTVTIAAHNATVPFNFNFSGAAYFADFTNAVTSAETTVETNAVTAKTNSGFTLWTDHIGAISWFALGPT